jgi:hypothetical protein
MAIMTFTPVNPLEQVLLDVSESGEHEQFLAALAANPVFVPGQAPPADGQEHELGEGDEVELPVFEHEGTRFVPVFTSLEQLEIGAPDAASYVRASGEDLASIWPEGLALAINPGGELSVAIPEEDVRALSATEHIPAGSDLTVGAPAEEPEELWATLRAWAATVPALRSAHRALVLVHAPGREPQLVVGLELDERVDPGVVLNAGAEALDGAAAFTLYDPDGDDPLSQWWREKGSPLYSRAQ